MEPDMLSKFFFTMEGGRALSTDEGSICDVYSLVTRQLVFAVEG